MFRIGDDLFVRLEDDDRNTLPAVAEVLTGALGQQELRDGTGAGDREPVTLTETGPDTGVFVGRLPTQFVAALASRVPGRLEKSPAPLPAVFSYRDSEYPGPGAPSPVVISKKC